MDQLFIDAIEQNPTAGYVINFRMLAESMHVRESADLEGLSAKGSVASHLSKSTSIKKDLGFDPTMKITDGEPSMAIERNGRSECIVIDGLIIRQCCMVGRATTCWKAHVKDHPETPLIIKDSWQPSEREEEGEMLKQATSRNVVNVARYYHHETVKIGGMIDDVCHCIRQELDITTASNYQQRLSQNSSAPTSEELPMRQTSTRTSTKRPFDQTGSALPPSKKTCVRSWRITATGPQNVVHWRVIVQDYGKAIYKASTRKALLVCLESCIKGH
ncbi:hypothetical protein E4U61_000423 [Claviceps capensis]|nr:hypothetical protein E4U61_000423 [Claviceps capensis]